jgi:hypothetical protein
MYIILLETGIKIVGYSMIIYSLWLIIGPLWLPFVQNRMVQMRSRRRVRRIKSLALQQQPTAKSKIFLHLELLLLSTKKEIRPHQVSNFIFLSVVLFSISSLFLIMVMEDIFIGVILGVIIGVMPYLVTLIKLKNIRSKNSISFLTHFHIILSNYQSTGKDIYFTIVNSIHQIKDPALRISFIKLVNAMQIQKSPDDFSKAIHIFIFSINSNFAKRFGKLVIKAHLSRSDIFNPLMQLDTDLRKRRIDIEEESTKNQDTVWQGYFPVVALPLAIFFSYQMSGVLDYWYFFTKKLNLSLFMVCIILSLLSVLIANVLRKPNADI